MRLAGFWGAVYTAFFLIIVACTPADILKGAAGALSGGTNVAANTQVGKENNQTIGTVSEVKTGDVEDLSVTNNSIWVIVLVAIVAAAAGAGWISPQPKWLKRKDNAKSKEEDADAPTGDSVEPEPYFLWVLRDSRAYYSMVLAAYQAWA